MLPWYLCIHPTSWREYSFCGAETSPSRIPATRNRQTIKTLSLIFRHFLWLSWYVNVTDSLCHWVMCVHLPWAPRLICNHCCQHHNSSRSITRKGQNFYNQQPVYLIDGHHNSNKLQPEITILPCLMATFKTV